MARRISKEKINAIATEYLTNGFDKVKALVSVGYALSYAQHAFDDIFSNVQLIAEIDRIQAKTAIKADVSRDYLIKKLQNIIEKSDANDGDIIRAASGIADLCGFKRENAPNEERERQKALKKTKEAEFIKKASPLVYKRVDELSKGVG